MQNYEHHPNLDKPEKQHSFPGSAWERGFGFSAIKCKKITTKVLTVNSKNYHDIKTDGYAMFKILI